MYEIVLTFNAIIDISSIVDYISNEIGNPSAAKKVSDVVRLKIESLKEYPKMCPLLDELPYSELGIRKLTINPFMAYYFVNDDDKKVYVISVTYQKRDQISQLLKLL